MNNKKLADKLDYQVRQLKKSEANKPTLFSQTVFIGTLGMLSILPIVGGAFLGNWLDKLSDDFSTRWTVSLIILGVILGSFNIYWFIKERQ